jgi:SAM-dependent methyltransferase
MNEATRSAAAMRDIQAGAVRPGHDVNWWTRPEWARRYLAERDDIPHRAEGVVVLLELVPPNAGRVLDLGTGDGYLMGAVRAARPRVEGVAVDFSTEMLRRARARFAGDPGVDVVEHDFSAPLPESWGSFDVVVSSFAIHHVSDERKRALYREVFDHLDPGGVFLNLEHVASPTPQLHESFLAAIGKTLEQDDPSNKLAPVPSQLDWLGAAGFEQVDCHWKWRELALIGGVRPR